MTTRLTTTLGALALGLAAFAATPVMAQGAGAGGAAGGAAGSAAGGTGSGGGNVPAQTPTTTNPGAGNTGAMGNGMNTEGMVRPMHHPHMASGTHVSHPATHHRRMASSRSATEGDAAIARLNEESLAAAQKGQTFTPSGTTQ